MREVLPRVGANGIRPVLGGQRRVEANVIRPVLDRYNYPYQSVCDRHQNFRHYHSVSLD